MEQQAKEIFPGITTEEMKAMYFDSEALIEAPYKVFQINSRGNRYYGVMEGGEPSFFPSVTTILSWTLPQNPFLVKWIADKGYDEAEAYKNERAYYGTFMHGLFETLLIERKMDLDGIKARLLEYMEQNNLPKDFIYYADDLKKDVCAFYQWVKDYKVKPLAIEIALVHPEKHYAGMVDLPCSLEIKGERINAIVDFKSGRKGFHEEHEIQLHLYKDLWNYNFPNCQITNVFNFAPKDWRKTPSYHFKDQTNSKDAEKIPYLLSLAMVEDSKRAKTFTAVSGVLDLDAEEDNIEDNILSISLADVLKMHTEDEKKDDTPEEDENEPLAELFAESKPTTPPEKKDGNNGKTDKNNLLDTILDF